MEEKIMEFVKESDMYVCASIEGKGVHIGRIKGIGYDADGTPILEVDIDEVNCTDTSNESEIISVDCNLSEPQLFVNPSEPQPFVKQKFLL